MENTSTYGKELAYDLRQAYAEIVSEHLKDIAEARKNDKYHVYYKCLEDLYTIVQHKFKDKKEKDVYKGLRTKAAQLANRYSSTWLGQAKDSTACAEIETSLRDMEMFLYEQMHHANMFGSNQKIPGL